jgi:hypothetical protein
MGGVNLIRLFDFYLAAMFLVGTLRRLEQYRTIGGIVVSAPGRWPKLLQVMKQHRAVFLTWSTVRPALLALALAVVQTVASRLIWPQANLTLIDLFAHWYTIPVLVLTGAPMLGVDIYFLVRVSRINRRETEEYLDNAEHWLTSWKGSVLRALTLGYVDPRRMVSVEVGKALTEISNLINRNLYWMSLQIGLRVLFGLALWGTWAFFGPSAR